MGKLYRKDGGAIKLINESLMYDVSEYINNYQARNGESPSRQEIADKFGMAVSKAHRYVLALQGRGMLKLPIEFTGIGDVFAS